MPDNANGTKHYVTLAELDAKLEKLPTRWEVRFLVLGGIVGAQLFPVNDIARAALSIF